MTQEPAAHYFLFWAGTILFKKTRTCGLSCGCIHNPPISRQETFSPFFVGLSPPRAGPGLFFFRVWAVCFLTPGAPRLCGRRLCACACGRLLRARGRGWVACSLPSSLLRFLLCCLLLLGFLAVPPFPRARVALGLLVGASPPARCAGGCSRRAGLPLPGLSSPGVTQHYNKKSNTQNLE